MSIYNIRYVAERADNELKIISVSNGDNTEKDKCIITLLEEFKGHKDIVRIEHWLIGDLYTLLNEDVSISRYDGSRIKDTRYKGIKRQLKNLMCQDASADKREELYTVRYYGVHIQYKNEFSDTQIYETKELRHAVPGFENSFFEITVLKEYEGKKEVLKLEFEDGEVAYETLRSPYYYWNPQFSKWVKAYDNSTSEAFKKVYLNRNKTK